MSKKNEQCPLANPGCPLISTVDRLEDRLITLETDMAWVKKIVMATFSSVVLSLLAQLLIRLLG